MKIKNYYLTLRIHFYGSNRLEKIFGYKKWPPNNVNTSMGYGYPGKFDNKTNSRHNERIIDEIIGLLMKEELEKWKGFRVFQRKDGSIFELKKCGVINEESTPEANDRPIYSYLLKDGSYNQGLENSIYINISPEQIILFYLTDKKKYDYFCNNFFYIRRYTSIFKEIPSHRLNELGCGNGYGGYIKDDTYPYRIEYDKKSYMRVSNIVREMKQQ